MTGASYVKVRPEHVVDVFVYVTVLNLAIEYVPTVISETFTLSLLTAMLLKVVTVLIAVLLLSRLGVRRLLRT